MTNNEKTLLALLRRYDAMLEEALCPRSDYEEFCAWIEARKALHNEALPWLVEKDEENNGYTKEDAAY